MYDQSLIGLRMSLRSKEGSFLYYKKINLHYTILVLMQWQAARPK